MIRHEIEPRSNWRKRVEDVGLVWHSVDRQPYWNEGVYYSFTRDEIATLEGAAQEIYNLFLRVGDAFVHNTEWLTRFGIPEYCHKAILDQWNAEPPCLNYGRLDVGFDGRGYPKLFEFNCDTPTSLLEASVVQWDWKEDLFPNADQFNSIHDRLTGKWAEIRTLLPSRHVHFGHVFDAPGEDTVTVAYLRDTAEQAGLTTSSLSMDDIGWDAVSRRFVDLESNPIETLFKLYPWEWIVNEQFGERMIESIDKTLWIEPLWKMLWSNKAILPLLKTFEPDNPFLLETSFHPMAGDYVRKPLLAREGANISIVRGGESVLDTGGNYGQEGYVYQQLYNLPEMAPGRYPVVGLWLIDGAPAGMGIREDGLITGNTARFVPHIVE